MPAARALWLIPEERVRARLAEVIGRLASAHGSPRFEPHVTLVAGITLEREELVARARTLARDTPPVAVTLTRLSGGPAYYRALVLDVACERLLALHRLAAALVGRAEDPAFRPHVSIMYADLTPASRAVIAAQIGQAWDLPCVLGRLGVVRVEGPPSAWTREEDLPASAAPTGS
ncbi:MAG TPA: 2'-5' RNA ligase family protein [Vicinamibacteria bacterium]|nr:2'-5' RNA ligase family protein [Vicinamibacteria bacterium]